MILLKEIRYPSFMGAKVLYVGLWIGTMDWAVAVLHRAKFILQGNCLGIKAIKAENYRK